LNHYIRSIKSISKRTIIDVSWIGKSSRFLDTIRESENNKRLGSTKNYKLWVLGTYLLLSTYGVC
jgi:hypothetical protein